MRNTTLSIIFCGLIVISGRIVGQEDLAEKKINTDNRRIPFSLSRNRVILPISINGSEPLDIILDTGMPMDGVYLFHKELVERLQITDGVKVQVGGAGSGEASQAIMADSMTLTAGDVPFHNQIVIVAQNETTQDFPTDGVIGYTLFGSYIVEIDYDENVLTLHDSSEFTPDSAWEVIPIRLKKNIPFLKATIAIKESDQNIPIDVYIDLAAGEVLELLVREDMKFSLPDSISGEQYLGTGLSGDISGKTGRISRLGLGSFELINVPATFPPADVRSKQQGADGILCNNALRRFNVVFDYDNLRLYLKPNSRHRQPFK